MLSDWTWILWEENLSKSHVVLNDRCVVKWTCCVWICFIIIYAHIHKQRLLSALIQEASLCSECRDSCLLKVLKVSDCWEVNSKQTPASISYFKAQGKPQKTEKRLCKSRCWLEQVGCNYSGSKRVCHFSKTGTGVSVNCWCATGWHYWTY